MGIAIPNREKIPCPAAGREAAGGADLLGIARTPDAEQFLNMTVKNVSGGEEGLR